MRPPTIVIELPNMLVKEPKFTPARDWARKEFASRFTAAARAKYGGAVQFNVNPTDRPDIDVSVDRPKDDQVHQADLARQWAEDEAAAIVADLYKALRGVPALPNGQVKRVTQWTQYVGGSGAFQVDRHLIEPISFDDFKALEQARPGLWNYQRSEHDPAVGTAYAELMPNQWASEQAWLKAHDYV